MPRGGGALIVMVNLDDEKPLERAVGLELQSLTSID
jgi:hypothetical protein